jgi:hypothetical protein
MGIIVNDTITLSTGSEYTGVYLAATTDPVEVRKISDTTNYTVRASFRMWINQTARNEDKATIDRVNVRFTIQEADLTQNLYTLAYTELKTHYSDTTDA